MIQDPLGAGTPVLPAADADTFYASTYHDLRRMARARLRGGGRNTVLDTTALVHESYLRLGHAGARQFPDRARFLVYAGRVMRSVIIDMVRQRNSERHGAGALHLTFTGAVAEQAGIPVGADQILQVHEALIEMAQVDPRMAQVVEMRYFGGLTDAEISAALGVSDRTVRRDWEQARLFLAEAMR